MPDDTIETVFGIYKNLLRCRICRRRATQFRLIATEVLKELVVEEQTPEVMGCVLGFFCDIHASEPGIAVLSDADPIDELVD